MRYLTGLLCAQLMFLAGPGLRAAGPPTPGAGPLVLKAAQGRDAAVSALALSPPGYEVLGELGRGRTGVFYRAR